MKTHAWVIVVAVAASSVGCKKKKTEATDTASGSGSVAATGSAGSAGSAPAVPDAAPAVITPPPPPPPAIDAATAAPPPQSALESIPAPTEDCDGAKCTEAASRQDAGSPERAALFKKGCETGDAPACASLAVTFEQGIGVAKDMPVAASLYDKACTLGDMKSCETFGMLMMYGVGRGPGSIEPKPDVGIAAMDKACKAEAGSACTKLGDYLISNGQRDRALQVYRGACDHKDKAACAALEKVK